MGKVLGCFGGLLGRVAALPPSLFSFLWQTPVPSPSSHPTSPERCSECVCAQPTWLSSGSCLVMVHTGSNMSFETSWVNLCRICHCR